jgi:hypothetical protein
MFRVQAAVGVGPGAAVGRPACASLDIDDPASSPITAARQAMGKRIGSVDARRVECRLNGCSSKTCALWDGGAAALGGAQALRPIVDPLSSTRERPIIRASNWAVSLETLDSRKGCRTTDLVEAAHTYLAGAICSFPKYTASRV